MAENTIKLNDQMGSDEKPIPVGRVVAIICLCTLFLNIASYKFIPMQAVIKEFFNVGDAAYGYLTSSNNWLMIAVSVPMGYLVRKWKPKNSMLLGFSVAILGIVIQALATSFPLFVVGRVVEGAGYGLATLVTSSLLINVVGSAKAGLWMSISMALTVGSQIITTKVGTALIYDAGINFKLLFWAIGAMEFVILLVWVLLIPKNVKIYGTSNAAKPTKEQTRRVYKNKSGWFVAIALGLFNCVGVAFPSYIIQYWVGKGMTQAEAANTHSITTLISLGAMLAFGFISDRLHTKRKIVIFSFFSAMCALVLLALLPANLMWIYVIIYGTLPRSIAGLTNASAADLAEVPADVPIVNSTRNTIVNILGVVFAIGLGYGVQFLGYQITIFIMSGFMLIGAILWILAKKIP